MSTEVINVDMKSAHNDGTKPAIASHLEDESTKLNEKRASLSKEEIDTRLREAETKRNKILDEKVALAKELEGHSTKSATGLNAVAAPAK